MGDSGRRRPPLRGDKEQKDARPLRKSPEPTKRGLDDQRVTLLEDERSQDDSLREIDRVISMLMECCSLDSETLESNLKDTLEYFESLNSPHAKRQFLLTTFALSLEDREFARSAGTLYGVMHTIKIENDTVRSLLLSAIQKELEDNDFRSGNRQRFLNAVFLLSELYYHVRFDDEPISVLGGELLKYFRWLLTGEEKELEVLATCIIVNGLVLKKDKPASYRKLLLEIRTTLVTRNLSPQSRSWLLLIVDMDNTMIGDEGFQKFKRVRPTIIRPSSPNDKSSEQQDSDSKSPDKEGRQVSFDVWDAHERSFSVKQRNSASQSSSESWQTSERRNSSERQSNPQKHSDSQKTTRTIYKRSETQNRPQRPAANYTGHPRQGSVGRRNVDIWTEPPTAVQSTFKSDKKIPVWQHEHDDRFDRDYND
ncbi:CBP80/20-dependent translation initiation factor [Gryllus bimaculatus]|nr:CBP80/20-dependent translation initiation factor [Gryllus bimaculatus]